MADEVLLGERRDYDEGHACARTAAAVHRLAVEAVRLNLRRNAGSALAGSVDLIGVRIVGRPGRLGVEMVVPAVGVVIGDYGALRFETPTPLP